MIRFTFTLALVLIFGLICRSQTNTFPSSGNVGIGTTSPDQYLHINVNSDSKPGGIPSPSLTALKISRSGTLNYSYPEAAEFRIAHGGPFVWGSKLDLYINGSLNETNIPDQHAMTWLYNGNVSIGTDYPTAKLEINSGPGTTTLRAVGSNGYLLIDNVGSGESYYQANKVHRFQGSSGVEILTMLGTGNVGIGSPNPTEKLSVNGKIRAHEIKVETANWPDYVFAKDYKLPTLQETATHIKEKGHLPGIPSAVEVKANGVDLGEMNARLLQKIEELTLHLIKQEKEITELKKRVQ